MPRSKGKKKEKQQRSVKSAAQSGAQASDEDSTDDTQSVMSTQSDGSLALGFDLPEGGDEVDETSAQENFEEKVKEVIDGLTEKSAKSRTESLKSLRAALAKRFMTDFVLGRKFTICDGLEKCLKKGKGEEQATAAICYVLVLNQLGAGVDSEELFKAVHPVLVTIMSDASASLKARASCAESLGLCSFIGAKEVDDVQVVMKNLENVFKSSYLKGDGSAPCHSPEVAALHTSALAAWTLLLTIAPPFAVKQFVDTHIRKLPQLLQSSDVDLRIAAGEAIALLYELAREDNQDFWGDNVEELIDTLKQLATDSNKYRAKKDRRQQRSSFRDILRAVEEGDSIEYQVKFGYESLYIDSWSKKRQYDSFCHVLSSGMNTHLQENDLVREIFGLGSPLPVGAKPTHKSSKSERQHYNAAAFKARTKARSKFRDKRSAVVGHD